MRICVIGGLGFIGTRLCERLEKTTNEFAILDKRAGSDRGERVIHGDVRSLEDVVRGTSGADVIMNLAAEHRDDVRPLSLYEDVNVGGARNICEASRRNGVNRIVFTSSVAVYGIQSGEPAESSQCRPVNEYGRTKLLAEGVFRDWQAEDPASRSLTIIRPTVVFGERNRGNVYNLLVQIAAPVFFMIGSGRNRKSMAYVGNVAALIEMALSLGQGVRTWNYVDKPDLDMSSFVKVVQKELARKRTIQIRIPRWAGILGGAIFDILGMVMRRPFL